MKARVDRIGSRFGRVISPAAVGFVTLAAVELGFLTRGFSSLETLLIPIGVFLALLIAGAMYSRARAHEHWTAAWDAYAELDLAREALVAVHDERAVSMAGPNGTSWALWGSPAVWETRPVATARWGLIQGGTPMLVLSRKPGQRVVVPHCELTVTIVSIQGDKVRLGFSAPPEISVLREEILDASARPNDRVTGSWLNQKDWPTRRRFEGEIISSAGMCALRSGDP
jgi:carbon storage regulator